MKSVYFLHEYGAPSHVVALNFLLKKHSYKLKHRELDLFSQLKKAIKSRDFIQFKKFLVNVSFLVFLLFTKNRIVLLGLAPYNNRLKKLSVLLKNHRKFYFTSYTCWDQSRMVHSDSYSEELLGFWRNYLGNHVEHIFAVSSQTKYELVKNKFAREEKVTVVNHSYNINISPQKTVKKKLKFIYVGRLVANKGIEELIQIFKNLQNAQLTIVGKGDLENFVRNASNEFVNIQYLGYINGLENLVPIYKEHSFFLLNSKKNNHWEELFGISLIEAMACGLVPIAVNHCGPLEIISDNYNGYIVNEGKISEGIEKAFELDQAEFNELRNRAIDNGKRFHAAQISMLWKPIILNK